jgi:hypothetical protein
MLEAMPSWATLGRAMLEAMPSWAPKAVLEAVIKAMLEAMAMPEDAW